MALEEDALAEAWQDHHKRQDRVARAKLILHYEPFARRLAMAQHRRIPRQVELDDLASIAITQMIRRIDIFNPDINESFELYAAQSIRGAMLDELRSMDRVSRVTRSDARAVSTAEEALERVLKRPPTLEEVATHLDRPTQVIRSTIAKVEASRTAYLDEGTVTTPPAPAPDSTIPVLQAEVVELIKALPITTQRILV
jgi:RNA polymerase sigma factor for flagellar operon FliA